MSIIRSRKWGRRPRFLYLMLAESGQLDDMVEWKFCEVVLALGSVNDQGRSRWKGSWLMEIPGGLRNHYGQSN